VFNQQSGQRGSGLGESDFTNMQRVLQAHARKDAAEVGQPKQEIKRSPAAQKRYDMREKARRIESGELEKPKPRILRREDRRRPEVQYVKQNKQGIMAPVNSAETPAPKTSSEEVSTESVQRTNDTAAPQQPSLDQVWPVDRTDQTVTDALPEQPSLAAAPISDLEAQRQRSAEMQRSLQDVQPTHQSRSSLEIVPPRRSRSAHVEQVRLQREAVHPVETQQTEDSHADSTADLVVEEPHRHGLQRKQIEQQIDASESAPTIPVNTGHDVADALRSPSTGNSVTSSAINESTGEQLNTTQHTPLETVEQAGQATERPSMNLSTANDAIQKKTSVSSIPQSADSAMITAVSPSGNDAEKSITSSFPAVADVMPGSGLDLQRDPQVESMRQPDSANHARPSESSPAANPADTTIVTDNSTVIQDQTLSASRAVQRTVDQGVESIAEQGHTKPEHAAQMMQRATQPDTSESIWPKSAPDVQATTLAQPIQRTAQPEPAELGRPKSAPDVQAAAVTQPIQRTVQPEDTEPIRPKSNPDVQAATAAQPIQRAVPTESIRSNDYPKSQIVPPATPTQSAQRVVPVDLIQPKSESEAQLGASAQTTQPIQRDVSTESIWPKSDADVQAAAPIQPIQRTVQPEATALRDSDASPIAPSQTARPIQRKVQSGAPELIRPKRQPAVQSTAATQPIQRSAQSEDIESIRPKSDPDVQAATAAKPTQRALPTESIRSNDYPESQIAPPATPTQSAQSVIPVDLVQPKREPDSQLVAPAQTTQPVQRAAPTESILLKSDPVAQTAASAQPIQRSVQSAAPAQRDSVASPISPSETTRPIQRTVQSETVALNRPKRDLDMQAAAPVQPVQRTVKPEIATLSGSSQPTHPIQRHVQSGEPELIRPKSGLDVQAIASAQPVQRTAQSDVTEPIRPINNAGVQVAARAQPIQRTMPAESIQLKSEPETQLGAPAQTTQPIQRAVPVESIRPKSAPEPLQTATPAQPIQRTGKAETAHAIRPINASDGPTTAHAQHIQRAVPAQQIRHAVQAQLKEPVQPTHAPDVPTARHAQPIQRTVPAEPVQQIQRVAQPTQLEPIRPISNSDVQTAIPVQPTNKLGTIAATPIPSAKNGALTDVSSSVPGVRNEIVARAADELDTSTSPVNRSVDSSETAVNSASAVTHEKTELIHRAATDAVVERSSATDSASDIAQSLKDTPGYLAGQSAELQSADAIVQKLHEATERVPTNGEPPTIETDPVSDPLQRSNADATVVSFANAAHIQDVQRSSEASEPGSERVQAASQPSADDATIPHATVGMQRIPDAVPAWDNQTTSAEKILPGVHVQAADQLQRSDGEDGSQVSAEIARHPAAQIQKQPAQPVQSAAQIVERSASTKLQSPGALPSAMTAGPILSTQEPMLRRLEQPIANVMQPVKGASDSSGSTDRLKTQQTEPDLTASIPTPAVARAQRTASEPSSSIFQRTTDVQLAQATPRVVHANRAQSAAQMTQPSTVATRTPSPENRSQPHVQRKSVPSIELRTDSAETVNRLPHVTNGAPAQATPIEQTDSGSSLLRTVTTSPHSPTIVRKALSEAVASAEIAQRNALPQGNGSAINSPLKPIATEAREAPVDLWRKADAVFAQSAVQSTRDTGIQNRPMQRQPIASTLPSITPVHSPSIATDVGYLPADLWRELDVEPPVNRVADTFDKSTPDLPLQRQSVEGKSSAGTTASTPMIATEIGQLPADLWRELNVVPSESQMADTVHELADEHPLQRQPAARVSTSGTSESPSLISTEVGQLPADLWRELGVAPPSAPMPADGSQSQAGLQRQTMPQRPLSKPENVLQREPDVEIAPDSAENDAENERDLPDGSVLLYVDEESARDAKQGTIPVWLQRQDGDGGAIIRAFADSSIFDDFEFNADKPEVSDTLSEDQVETLSRQVYSQLKRKLDVDWERARARI
jgi:hypothetical protein